MKEVSTLSKSKHFSRTKKLAKLVLGCQCHGSNPYPAGAPRVPKNEAHNSPCPETVAAAAMLALPNTTNVVRLVLARISLIPEAFSVALKGDGR